MESSSSGLTRLRDQRSPPARHTRGRNRRQIERWADRSTAGDAGHETLRWRVRGRHDDSDWRLDGRRHDPSCRAGRATRRRHRVMSRPSRNAGRHVAIAIGDRLARWALRLDRRRTRLARSAGRARTRRCFAERVEAIEQAVESTAAQSSIAPVTREPGEVSQVRLRGRPSKRHGRPKDLLLVISPHVDHSIRIGRVQLEIGRAHV